MSGNEEDAIPRHFASWEEYWALRHDPALWLPYFRKALRLAEMPANEMVMLGPSQYPHARAGNVVITIYPDASIAKDTDACFRLLAGDPKLTPSLLRGCGIAPTTNSAVRLLGWALLHDFDGITGTVQARRIPESITDIDALAGHLTGLRECHTE